MALRPELLRTLHLCSGYAGFELALRDVARSVGHVERDAYAAATLVAHMEAARLDPAPIWSDLTTFDGRPWRGRVDLVTAGFPCPDFSTAGKRAGVHGERWLWPSVSRVIGEVEPRYVFLENVPGLVRLGGLTRVLSDLADFGFDAEWGLLPASAVGAPHRRERIWIVAHADRVGQPHARRSTARQAGRRASVARNGSDVGHSGGAGRPEVTRGAHGDEGADGSQHGHIAHCPSEDVADAAGVNEREPHHQGRTVARQDPRADVGGHRFPPSPDDIDGWERWTAEGGPQPGIRRGPHGAPLGLADALHLGGNGLVPQCARAAWDLLRARAGWGDQ